MKKNYKIDIPEYLSIDRYQRLQNLEHLTELEKLIETVYVFTGIKKDEIKTWAIADLGKVTNDFSTKVDVTSQFYPIWQHNEVNYGYADISTMTLAEFIDLETLCKKPTENLHEIMAVLYRPITTHRFNKLSWKIKHNVKLFQEKLGNVFKYYELKKYDSKTRYVDAEVMKDLPAGFALGALSFFLGTANLHWINSLSSLKTLKTEKMVKLLEKQTMEALIPTGDGLRRYIRSPKQIYSVSQEKTVSLT